MGLDSVLQSNDMGDRLGRDGFKISEDWQSSHVTGFSTRANSGFSTQNSQSGGMYPNSNGYVQPGDNVQYQQPPHSGHHAQQGQGGGYTGGWYSNQMS